VLPLRSRPRPRPPARTIPNTALLRGKGGDNVRCPEMCRVSIPIHLGTVRMTVLDGVNEFLRALVRRSPNPPRKAGFLGRSCQQCRDEPKRIAFAEEYPPNILLTPPSRRSRAIADIAVHEKGATSIGGFANIGGDFVRSRTEIVSQDIFLGSQLMMAKAASISSGRVYWSRHSSRLGCLLRARSIRIWSDLLQPTAILRQTHL